MSKCCRCCKRCLFFYPLASLREREEGRDSGMGECRRMPPAVMDSQEYGIWPIVASYDWCGEQRPGGHEEAGFL